MTDQYLINKIEELEKRIEVLENKKPTPKKRKKEKKEEKEYTAGYENITKDPFCGEGW